jgi:hypothetical protein
VLGSAGLFAQDFEYIDSAQIRNLRQKQVLKREIILKTNPGSILFGHFFPVCSEYKMVAEAVVSRLGGVHLGLSYYAMSPWLKSVINNDSSMANAGLKATDFAMNGFRFQVGYRFYLADPTVPKAERMAGAPGGFYLMPHYSYSQIELKYKGGGYRERFYLQNLTVNFGYQVILDPRWVLDMYIGAGYKNNKVLTDHGGRWVANKTYAEEVPILFRNPVKLNLGFMLGYRF